MLRKLLLITAIGMLATSLAYGAEVPRPEPKKVIEASAPVKEAPKEAPKAALTRAEIGKGAPEFAATDINGREQKLSTYAGKIVVIEWNNPDCPFVKKHYDSGNMQALQRYAQEKGVVWIAINSAATGRQGYMSADRMRDVLLDRKSEVTTYIQDPEGKIGHLYDAKVTPHMYVIDKMGVLVYAGAIDDHPSVKQDDIAVSKNYVREALDSLLKGEPVKTATTTAYGCTVKYKD